MPKETFIQKFARKRLEPIIDNLLYACFYHYVQCTGNPTHLTFDKYAIIIRDLLNSNVVVKEEA